MALTDEEKALAVKSKLSGELYIGQRVRVHYGQQWHRGMIIERGNDKHVFKVAVALDDSGTYGIFFRKEIEPL